MAPPTNPTLSTVILTNSEDWEPWFKCLQAHVNKELWPYIDPEQPENPLPEPPIKPTITDINPAATLYHQLTPAQQKVYENSRKFYDSDMKYYTTQTNQLKEASSFITATISETKLLHLDMNASVREWLVTLKRNTEPAKAFMIRKAVEEYNNVLRARPSRSRIGKWIQQWEQAMVKGQKYGIAPLANGQWLQDLADAIHPLSDVLYNKYMDQADDPELSMASEYIEVGKKLRQVLDHKVVRTTRGSALAADFAGTEEDPDATDNSRKEADKPPRSRKRAGTKSIEGETSSSKRSTNQKCPACGLRGHALPGCWCIFEDQRPDGVTVPESRVKKALKAVNESEELTKQVRKLKLEAEMGDKS
jgi:hypothetical protein